MLKRRTPGATRSSGEGAPRVDYAGLRDGVLGVDPASLGLAASPELPDVYGLLMDTSYETGTATVVVLAEGTTSLYTSTGGALLGAGEHAAVAEAGAALLRSAQGSLGAFGAGSGDVPPPGHVALVALTYQGLRRVEAPEGELAAGRHPASTVYEAAQHVVAAIRAVS